MRLARALLSGASLVVLASLAACQRSVQPEPASRAASTSSPAPAAPKPEADRSYRHPASERLVAVGDLHGDLTVTRKALRLAGAIDAADRWIGGKLVVVQTGDEIDRGDDDRAIVELFDRIADAASAVGGHVYPLIGNHEAMNVAGDFRYVTRGGFAAFEGTDTSHVPGAALARLPVEERGRLAAFQPGGPLARRLAQRDTVVVVGDTVFVHGGVTTAIVSYGIGRLNREVKRWMEGTGAPPGPVEDPEGPLWTRRFSDDKAGLDCAGLAAALAAAGAKRMVVGHTPHEEGVSSACDGHVWRIDTGLSSYYGGKTEVLEIRGEAVSVLRSEAGSGSAPGDRQPH